MVLACGELFSDLSGKINRKDLLALEEGGIVVPECLFSLGWQEFC